MRFEKSTGEKLSRSSVWVTWIPPKVAGLESCLVGHPPVKPDCWVKRAQHLETIGYSSAVMEGDVGGCWFSHVREVEPSWKPQEIGQTPHKRATPAILPGDAVSSQLALVRELTGMQ